MNIIIWDLDVDVEVIKGRWKMDLWCADSL